MLQMACPFSGTARRKNFFVGLASVWNGQWQNRNCKVEALVADDDDYSTN